MELDVSSIVNATIFHHKQLEHFLLEAAQLSLTNRQKPHFLIFCSAGSFIFINHHYFILSSDFKSVSIAFSFLIPQSREQSDGNKVRGRGCIGLLEMHQGSLFQHLPKRVIYILGEYIKA